MFPTAEDALRAYAAASAEMGALAAPTHELEWRLIYQNRESRFRTLVGLLMVPMGHGHVSHAEFRFKTRHAFSAQEARRLYLGRVLGSIAYYFCFVGLIAIGVGGFLALVELISNGFSAVSVAALLGCLTAAWGLLVVASKTRSLGLFGSARTIAKDAFDLLSIRRIRQP